MEGKYKQCLDSGNINVNLPNLIFFSTEKYVGRNIFLNSRSQGGFLHMKTDKVFKGIGSTNLLDEKHPQAHWPSQSTDQKLSAQLKSAMCCLIE